MVIRSGKRYGEGMMFVSVEEFQTYAVHIIDDLKDSDGKIHHSWILPALFDSLPTINDPLYLECDRTMQIVQYSNRRRANVELLQKLFPESSSDLKRRNIMNVLALHHIENEEEPLLDYGSSYHFESAPWAAVVYDLENMKYQVYINSIVL